MLTVLAQIAPQRSTQYAELASALAPHELQISPIGDILETVGPVTLGGQTYLKLSLSAEPDARQITELGGLAMTRAFFRYFEAIGGQAGPFLQPVETGFMSRLPPELMAARRYKGKTNELFTHFLCNVARFGSGFARTPWHEMRVFDPLMGGGTTAFTALVLGADAAGVEKNERDVQTTATFLRQFCRETGIACQMQREKRRGLVRRWWFTIGKERPQRCLLVEGDTVRSAEHLEGFKRPHLIVTDLPYGIQHFGQLEALLASALPVWESLLLGNGALAFAWESSRFSRARMIGLVNAHTTLTVLDDPPYDRLAHRVDRVIRQRDVIVAWRKA